VAINQEYLNHSDLKRTLLTYKTSWKQFNREANAPTGSKMRIKHSVLHTILPLIEWSASSRQRRQALLTATMILWRLQVWAEQWDL